MLRIIVLLAALVAAPALAGDPPSASPQSAIPVPAETVECLQTRSIQQSEAGIDAHWYVRTYDHKWWRNNMECPGISPGRAIVHTSPIGSQCRGDIIQVVDFSLGGVNYGGCGFGAWERVAGPPVKPPKAARK